MENVTIQILSGGRVQEPVTLEGITWETARKGEPSKLSFTVVKDDNLSFDEGKEVTFKYGNTNVFHGFVFQKQRNKDHHIQVTAYDQLRYLKAQDSYIFEGKRADQIIKQIAEDFRLKVGSLSNTGYVIPQHNEPNKTLFDIILDALDKTVMNTGNLFYLYDDFGKLTLKNINDSKIDLMIDSETAEDFDYTTSIDSNTYNKIKLQRKSEKGGKTETFIAQHGKNINRWGVLQLFEDLKDNENGKAKAEALLKLHNKVFRSLVIKNHIGDIRARAGVGVYMDLNLGDMIAKKHMLVEKAKHTFDNGHHYMDLTLNGNEEFYG